MGCGFLDVAQRHARVECGGDECVPERVGTYRLADPGAAGYPANDPGGTVAASTGDAPGAKLNRLVMQPLGKV
jgi:hypothetical protein